MNTFMYVSKTINHYKVAYALGEAVNRSMFLNNNKKGHCEQCTLSLRLVIAGLSRSSLGVNTVHSIIY